MKNRKAEPGLRLINMENVAVEQVEWLLYPFIPYGKVTIIQGDPGEGKTTMVLQIIAKLTKGEPVLPVKDGEEEPTEKADEPVNVIYQTAEDGLGDTIKPRLVVLDPIQSFLGAEVDMHRANEIRPTDETGVCAGGKISLCGCPDRSYEQEQHRKIFI